MSEPLPAWASYPGDALNLRRVSRNLWVGAAPAVTQPGWHTVVTLCRGAPQVSGPRAYARPFSDGDAFPEGLLDAVYELYRTAEGPMLVHCAMGLSRSPSAVYALLRRRHGLTHDAALDRVRTPGYRSFPLANTLASARAWVHESRRR